jgi:hypothetical protein
MGQFDDRMILSRFRASASTGSYTIFCRVARRSSKCPSAARTLSCFMCIRWCSLTDCWEQFASHGLPSPGLLTSQKCISLWSYSLCYGGTLTWRCNRSKIGGGVSYSSNQVPPSQSLSAELLSGPRLGWRKPNKLNSLIPSPQNGMR